MSKQDEYRRNAADTVDLASRAATTTDRGRLLQLAEKWLDLADRTERIARRPSTQIGDHPLVKKALGGDQSEVT